MATPNSIRMGKTFIELGLDQTKLDNGLIKAEKRLATFAAATKRMGLEMAKVTAGLAAPLALSARVFMDFERQMSRVKALAQPTASEFERLSQRAQDLGKSTVYTATQAAEAMSFFALAGYNTKGILDAIGPTLDMAAAGQMDIAEAADIAAKTMAGMGVASEDVGHAIDVLTKAMTTANTDLIQLGNAMKYVGPIAKSAGLSIEEVVAAVQMLSNAGMQSDMAGTSLRGIILSLVSPGTKARNIMSDLGVVVEKTNGDIAGLASIIDSLNAVTAHMGRSERLGIIGELFDLRQTAAIAELMTKGGDAMREATEELETAGGSAARVAGIQLDNLYGSAIILKSALQGLGIVVGDVLAPALRVVADCIRDVVQGAVPWVENNKAVVTTLGLIAVVGGTATGILLSLSMSAKIMSVAVAGWNIVTSIQNAKMLEGIFLMGGLIAEGHIMIALKGAWTSVTMILSAALSVLRTVLVSILFTLPGIGVLLGATALAASFLGGSADKTRLKINQLTGSIEDLDKVLRDSIKADRGKLQRLEQLAEATTRSNTGTREMIRLHKELNETLKGKNREPEIDMSTTHKSGLRGRVDLGDLPDKIVAKHLQTQLDLIDDELKRNAIRGREWGDALGREEAPDEPTFRKYLAKRAGRGATVRQVSSTQFWDVSFEKMTEAYPELYQKYRDEIKQREGDQTIGGLFFNDPADRTKGVTQGMSVRDINTKMEQVRKSNIELYAKRKELAAKLKDMDVADGKPPTTQPNRENEAEWQMKREQLELVAGIQDRYEREEKKIVDKTDRAHKKAVGKNESEKTLKDIKAVGDLKLKALQEERDLEIQKAELTLAHDLSNMRIGLIEDEHRQEIASINEKYQYEIDMANLVGDSKKASRLSQAQVGALAAANDAEALRLQEEAGDVATENLERKYRSEKLALQLQYEGFELERKTLELEKNIALIKARAAGENLDMVREEYDLMIAVAKKEADAAKVGASVDSSTIAGTFSADAVRGMGENKELRMISQSAQRREKSLQQIADRLKGRGNYSP